MILQELNKSSALFSAIVFLGQKVTLLIAGKQSVTTVRWTALWSDITLLHCSGYHNSEYQSPNEGHKRGFWVFVFVV